nr:MAG TPA: hypothetical protein [Caudoviricetes sp.]
MQQSHSCLLNGAHEEWHGETNCGTMMQETTQG